MLVKLLAFFCCLQTCLGSNNEVSTKSNTTCDLSTGWLPGAPDSGKCYKLVKGTHASLSACYTGGWGFNWFDGYKCCYSVGAYLAEPQNTAESLVISTYITIANDEDLDSKWWIGATNLHHHNTWTWMSGAPWVFDNWNTTQPGQGEEENCSMISSREHLMWVSEKCLAEYTGGPHFVICEKLLG